MVWLGPLLWAEVTQVGVAGVDELLSLGHEVHIDEPGFGMPSFSFKAKTIRTMEQNT